MCLSGEEEEVSKFDFMNGEYIPPKRPEPARELSLIEEAYRRYAKSEITIEDLALVIKNHPVGAELLKKKMDAESQMEAQELREQEIRLPNIRPVANGSPQLSQMTAQQLNLLRDSGIMPNTFWHGGYTDEF